MATSVIDQSPILLTSSGSTILTTATGESWNISCIRVNNVSSGVQTLTMWDYASGGTKTQTVQEVGPVSIEAGSTLEVGPMILPAARVIEAVCSLSGAMSARVHGWKMV